MVEKEYKITQKEFDYFSERVGYWWKKLGVSWLDIEILLVDLGRDPGGRTVAQYEYSEKFGSARIKLNAVQDNEPTRYELDSVAFHEVFEMGYLGDLRAMAAGTYSSYEVEKATHKTIRVAENVLFPELRGRGY